MSYLIVFALIAGQPPTIIHNDGKAIDSTVCESLTKPLVQKAIQQAGKQGLIVECVPETIAKGWKVTG